MTDGDEVRDEADEFDREDGRDEHEGDDVDDDGEYLGPFSRAVLEAVAAERDLSAAAVASLVDRHQRQMAEFPGAENLVYEWRRSHDGAVLARTDEAYYCSVPEGVWSEFADALGLTPEEGAALEVVHREVLDRRADCPDDPGANRTAVVVTRSDPA